MTPDDLDTLITFLPPPPIDRGLSHPEVRRAHLVRGVTAGGGRSARRWRIPAPALAAGALAATVAVGAVGGMVLNRQDNPTARPGTSATHVPSPVTSMNDLLKHLDAVAARQPVVKARDNQFVYVRSQSPKDPAAVGDREIWQSVDGIRAGLLSDSKGDSSTPLPTEQLPTGTSAIDAAIDYPTFRRLSELNTAPAALLTAIKKVRKGHGDDPNAEAFDALRNMLTEQIVQPKVRALIYHTAALVPGAFFVADATDGIGRHGPAIGFKRRGSTELLVIDLTTTALLGNAGYAVVASAIVDRAGQRPVGLPGAPVPSDTAKPPATAHEIDWANGGFSLPNDPHFTKVPTPADGSNPPIATFRKGVAEVTGPDGSQVRYEFDLKRRPPIYGHIIGSVDEDIVLTMAIRRADGTGQVSYAVLLFRLSHEPPVGTLLVTWLDAPSAAPRVTVKDRTVSVGSQHYHWNGKKFAKTN
jgi:hypothetical protein